MPNFQTGSFLIPHGFSTMPAGPWVLCSCCIVVSLNISLSLALLWELRVIRMSSAFFSCLFGQKSFILHNSHTSSFHPFLLSSLTWYSCKIKQKTSAVDFSRMIFSLWFMVSNGHFNQALFNVKSTVQVINISCHAESPNNIVCPMALGPWSMPVEIFPQCFRSVLLMLFQAP